MSAMSAHVDELRRTVADLREDRAAARAVAREASSKAAKMLASGGLALTALNVAVSIWLGVH